ncbi:hypothetical protein ASPCAL12953 [Aspergillus calidoustus]|uniref:DUF1996 domain-containing protein n=1 Tax=Aspergillus calidoustus TaxID=454130 RepID=A0A0U5GDP0_ASPCI|nr:hypothetical protein ASPCAL12953 [Aspergillus calidoustus]
MLLSFLLTAGLARAYTVTNVELFMFKNIDPIVFPGQYVSHMHSFFGSDAVNINTSTSAELREGCSTARNPNDFSVYWVPTLFHVNASAPPNKTHTPITPYRFSAYYELLNEAEIPFPENFQVVAGNASATSSSDLNPDNGITWFCEGDDAEENKEKAAFPTKTCSTHLQTLLLFPDCANPETFETAYSKNPRSFPGYNENRCPDGMYRIPRLRFSIRYDLRDILPDGWEGAPPPLELACGNEFCSHGDFINGWLPEAAEYMLEDPTKAEYFQIKGPLGDGDQGTACTRAAGDSDPEHGTSDYAESLRMMAGRSTSTSNATSAAKFKRGHQHGHAHRRY